MGDSHSHGDIYECIACGSLSYADPDSTCCGDGMEPVEATPVRSPGLPLVLREVFGISETGLNVCLCLMKEGDSTVSDIADDLGLDRSTVTRQVNHLADIGIVEKRERLLRAGGYVNVYSHEPVEVVQRRMELGLYAWLADAMELVGEINAEKLAAASQFEADAETGAIYWDG